VHAEGGVQLAVVVEVVPQHMPDHRAAGDGLAAACGEGVVERRRRPAAEAGVEQRPGRRRAVGRFGGGPRGRARHVPAGEPRQVEIARAEDEVGPDLARRDDARGRRWE
jgi:hypothetical protein